MINSILAVTSIVLFYLVVGGLVLLITGKIEDYEKKSHW